MKRGDPAPRSKARRRTTPKEEQIEPLQVEDPSVLTDADWFVLNELYSMARKPKALLRACRKLAREKPGDYLRLLAALDPVKTREAALDAAAAEGLDVADLPAMIRQLESPSKKTH